MYIYQEKDNLMHKLHPMALIIYVFVLSTFALLFLIPSIFGTLFLCGFSH